MRTTTVAILLGCLVSATLETTLVIEPVDATVIDGHTAKFNCKVDGLESGYTVGWKHDDVVISVDGETVIAHDDRYAVFRDSLTERYLYVMNVTSSDEYDNYRCVVYGENATSYIESSDATIAVTEPSPIWPDCEPQPSSVEFNPGHVLWVTCAARGEGETWLLSWSRSDDRDPVRGIQRLYPYLPDVGFDWTLSEDDDGVTLTCIAAKDGETDKSCNIGPMAVSISYLVLYDEYEYSQASLSLTCSLEGTDKVTGVSYMWVFDNQYIVTSNGRFTIGNDGETLLIDNVTPYDVGSSVQCIAHAAVIRDKYAFHVITLPTEEPIYTTTPVKTTPPSTAVSTGNTTYITIQNTETTPVNVAATSTALIATTVLTAVFVISTITLSIIMVVVIMRSRRQSTRKQADNSLNSYDNEAAPSTPSQPQRSLHYEVTELKLQLRHTTDLENGSNKSYVNTPFHEKNAAVKENSESKLYDVVENDGRRPIKALKPPKPTTPMHTPVPQQEQTGIYKSLNRNDMIENSHYTSPVLKPRVLTKPKNLKKKKAEKKGTIQIIKWKM